MLFYPLTNFKIQKYQKEPRFNCFYSRNNFPMINDSAYIINLDGCKSFEIHQIALYVNSNNVTNFDVGVEYIPNKIENSIGNKNINIPRTNRIILSCKKYKKSQVI